MNTSVTSVSSTVSSPDNYFDNLNRDTSSSKAQECFDFFDEDRDGGLNIDEFHQLCCHLISSPDVNHKWTRQDTVAVMEVLNVVESGKLDEKKFQVCWENWITPILAPKCALVVTDVQNDFISGSLALRNGPAGEDGEEVVPVINRLLNTLQFDAVIYSQDWHPSNHISFYENRHIRKFHSTSLVTSDEVQLFDTVLFDGSKPYEQILWPAHCVQNSGGAEFHKDLSIVTNHFRAFKGTNPERDSYSILHRIPEPKNDTAGQALVKKLRLHGITDLFLCGLALDFCVGYTALDSRSFGFRTVVITDACRGINEETKETMSTNMKDVGCALVEAKEVADMISGHYRHPKLAYFAAMDIATEK